MVPAVGDPDLSRADPRDRPSLAAVIGAGDPDALAGFRDAHLEQVRSYCAEVCQSERVQEAVDAAFVDFVARLRGSEALADERLGELLLSATRSAAAGRFEVWRPLAAVERGGAALPRECAAMPELLAAAANAELRRNRSSLDQHLRVCETCATTAERINQAERMFAQGQAAP